MIKKSDIRRLLVIERQGRFYESVLPLITETPNQPSSFYAKLLGMSTSVTAGLLWVLSKKTGITHDIRRRPNGKTRVTLWRLDHQPEAPLFTALKRKEQAARASLERQRKKALARQKIIEDREKKRAESEKRKALKKEFIHRTPIREEDKEWINSLKKTPQEKLRDLLDAMDPAPIPRYDDYFKANRERA